MGRHPTSLPVQGFNPAEVPTSYGDTIHFWDWQERKLVQSIKLGSAGGLCCDTDPVPQQKETPDAQSG